MPFGADYVHHSQRRQNVWSQGWVVTPVPVAATEATASPAFPHRSLAAPRPVALNISRSFVQIADASQPAGVQRWVDVAPAARRLADYTVAVTPQQLLVTSAAPVWPAAAPAFRRLLGYTFTATPALADASLPAGTPRYPSAAPSARRAASRAYDVSLQFPPTPVVVAAMASTPVFPVFARAPRRAGPSAYQALSAYQPGPPADLGRFRLGDVIFTTYRGWASPVPPQAVFVGPSGQVANPQLATRDQVNFTAAQLLGEDFELGQYTLTVGGTNIFTFAVVAGGDAEGAILGIYSTKNAQGKLVITQTRAGEILFGLNPRFPSRS